MVLWQMLSPKPLLQASFMENHSFVIRPAVTKDLPQLLGLYTHLHEDSVPDMVAARLVFEQILQDDKQSILLGEIMGEVVSSCTIITVPNLTQGLRAYCLIENVVTHNDYRGNGYASKLLQHAKELAIKNNCYKIMLMTGSKEQSILSFYEKAGFNRQDKTAFVQWL